MIEILKKSCGIFEEYLKRSFILCLAIPAGIAMEENSGRKFYAWPQ